MISRIEHTERPTRTARPPFEVFAVCDDEPLRLEGPCRELPNGRTAALIRFDCAGAIDAAFKGVVDVLVVDWNRSTPAQLTALNFLHREKPGIRLYAVMDDAGAAPRLQPWKSGF